MRNERVGFVVFLVVISLLAPSAHVFTSAQPKRQPASQESLRQNAQKVLDAGIANDNKGDRATAVRTLGLLKGNLWARSAAENALKDKEVPVRAAAAVALGQMDARESIPQLQAMFTDSSPEVVIAAASALRNLGDVSAFGVYYAVLTGERKTGESLTQQQLSMLKDPKKMAAIGFTAGIGFVPFGGAALGAINAMRKDDVSPVRAAAAKILANDPDPHSKDALVQAVSDKSALVRAAALDALARRGDATVLSAVEPALADKEELVRYTAAAAVLHLTKAAGR
jgi:HEAT repeat protein